MALSVALPLSGLETENYNTFNSFGITEITGLSQSSPTPSVSSESSGIGSLGSLKSESGNCESIPSSPQTTEKKVFEQEKPKKDVKVVYGGRDILNLDATLKDNRWNYRATYLPPSNPALFFANRSQYHRLSPFSNNTQYVFECCEYCDFKYVIAATD